MILKKTKERPTRRKTRFKSVRKVSNVNMTNYKFLRRKRSKRMRTRKAKKLEKEFYKQSLKEGRNYLPSTDIDQFFHSKDGKKILSILCRYGIFNLKTNREFFLSFLKNEINVFQMITRMNFPKYYKKKTRFRRSPTRKAGMIHKKDEFEKKKELEDSSDETTKKFHNIEWTLKKSRILEKIRSVIQFKIKLRKEKRKRMGSKLDRNFAKMEEAWLKKIKNGNISCHSFKGNYFDKKEPLKHMKLRTTSILTQMPRKGKVVPENNQKIMRSHQRIFNSLTDKYLFVLRPSTPTTREDKLKEWLKISNYGDIRALKKEVKKKPIPTLSSFNKGNFEEFLYAMKFKEKERKLREYFKFLISESNSTDDIQYGYDEDFLDLELDLMLRDVLEFNPLDENQVNNILESKEDQKIVAICPKDWVRTKKVQQNRARRMPSMNKKFLSASVDKNNFGYGENLMENGYYVINRNRARSKGRRKNKRFERVFRNIRQHKKKFDVGNFEDESYVSDDDGEEEDSQDFSEKSQISCVSFTENQLNVLYRNSKDIQLGMESMRNKHKPWTKTLKNLFRLKELNQQMKNIHTAKRMV